MTFGRSGGDVTDGLEKEVGMREGQERMETANGSM